MNPEITLAAADTHTLLTRLRTFCFPRGEAAARLIRAVRTTQIGEMRMSPEARWIPFTATETIEATRSCFRWEARLDPDKIGSPSVTDAYEQGHGRLVVKLGGILPVKNVTGVDADKGEIQRYLASMLFCPPILLNHLTLEWEAIGPSTLRVHDRADPATSTINVDLSDDGCPLVCYATRPRIVGKQTILTPWSGKGSEFREYAGLRAPTLLEVAWHLPDGPFTYFREEITSFSAIH
jgi:hypothetical protein